MLPTFLPAVYTPLKGQCLNTDVIPAYLQYLVKSGLKAALVSGTNGEGTSLRLSDRKKLIDSWIEASKQAKLHIMVQVGGVTFPDVIDLAKHCESVGVNSLLTLPEIYFKPQSVSELVSYVRRVAEAAPNLPVIYYHSPARTKVELNMSEFVRTATSHIPNFKGLKYAGKDLTEAMKIRRNLNADQVLYISSDELIAPASLLGVKYFTTGPMNFFPRLETDIVTAIENNDILAARTLQENLTLTLDSITEYGNRIPVFKATMEIVSGLELGPPSLPHEPLSNEARQKIEQKLKSLQLI